MRANFEHTGAVQPSSRFLARAMVAPLCHGRRREAAAPARVLEIGPGTGAMTRAAAVCMGAEDELVCYEINGAFVRILRTALREDPRLSSIADRTTVHHAPVQELPAGEQFDFAICSAPLNNFDAETIDAVLSTMMGAASAADARQSRNETRAVVFITIGRPPRGLGHRQSLPEPG